MNNSTILSNSSRPTYENPALYRDEIMEIYIWPFIFVVLYTVLGCFGNLLVFYIYFFELPHTKTRIFILALAVVDFVNSSFNMPIEAVILWDPMQFDYHDLCKTTRGVTFVINNVSACILVAIAIDRVFGVYKPLKRRTLTMKYAKRSCLIAFLLGVVTGWPGFVFYGTATIPEKLSTVTVLGKTCYISDEYLTTHTQYPFIFSIILFILMVLVFLILTTLYIMTGIKLYLVSKGDLDGFTSKRKTSLVESLTAIAMGHVNNNSEADLGKKCVSFKVSENILEPTARPQGRRMSRRVSGTNLRASRDNTITMAMVAVAFMISFLPYVIIVTLRYININFYFDLNKNERIAYHVFLRQYFLNSVINPFIYSFSNKQFRLAVAKTFRRVKERMLHVSEYMGGNGPCCEKTRLRTYASSEDRSTCDSAQSDQSVH